VVKLISNWDAFILFTKKEKEKKTSPRRRSFRTDPMAMNPGQTVTSHASSGTEARERRFTRAQIKDPEEVT